MKKSGFADWNTTTFTEGSASISVISAPNSTIVAGTKMLIGGLLKVMVHRPGQVRSMLNCEWSGMAYFFLSCEEPCRSDLKPARTSSEKSVHTKRANGVLVGGPFGAS